MDRVVIERNAKTNKFHPTFQTQVSIAYRYFWEGEQARFPALSSSAHSTYSRWGSYQAHMAASQSVPRRPAATAILEPHENHDGKVVLLEMVYTIGIKHSCRGHHYIVQHVLILKAVRVTYLMEHSNPFMENPVQTENGHTANACAGRHMLTVVTLSPSPVS
jgi:hypothetical protein